jgi:Ca2+-binding RTX toxin-like protein
LAGGAGRDLVEGGAGPDSLHSGDLSNFSPPGGPGGIEDRLLGGTGDDFLQGTRSNDHFDGGPGSDTVFPGSPDRLRSPELRVDLRIQGSPQDTGDGGHDTLFSVEGAFGDDGRDVLIGDGQANFLYGSSESDLLVGGGGDDEIDGGGTWHVDTASYGAPFSTPTTGVAVTFSGPAKAEAINGDDVDSLTSIRRIVGTPYPDQLLGAKGPQRLIGGRGPDRLSGGPGPDALRGSRGADHLTGGAARDGLLGGPGIDRLFALDDQRDRVLACGRGADLRERVRRDAIDPEPISC